MSRSTFGIYNVLVVNSSVTRAFIWPAGKWYEYVVLYFVNSGN